MKSHETHDRPSHEWLRRMAELEDSSGSVLVGGLAEELGMFRGHPFGQPRVFGRFLEFARRTRGLTVEKLAEVADVDLAELVAIECDPERQPKPRTVYQLAQILRLPAGRLLELCGLAEPKDNKLGEAALRFAARSEPSAQLSPDEREAFEEFVKVIVEASDRR